MPCLVKFSSSKMRIQFSGFLALSSQAVLAELSQRTSNVWTTQNLRDHLAQKFEIAPTEILVKVATDDLDIGTCDCSGENCFPASKTPIEFIINGKVFLIFNNY